MEKFHDLSRHPAVLIAGAVMSGVLLLFGLVAHWLPGLWGLVLLFSIIPTLPIYWLTREWSTLLIGPIIATIVGQYFFVFVGIIGLTSCLIAPVVWGAEHAAEARHEEKQRELSTKRQHIDAYLRGDISVEELASETDFDTAKEWKEQREHYPTGGTD